MDWIFEVGASTPKVGGEALQDAADHLGENAPACGCHSHDPAVLSYAANDVSTLTVVGPPPGGDPPPYPDPDPNGGGGGSGGGPSPTDGQGCWDSATGPYSPQQLYGLRTMANVAQDQLANMSKNIEHGAWIYALGGSTGLTTMRDGTPDDIHLSTSDVPDGAVIVGWVHAHPETTNVDERFPSAADWQTVDTMLGATLPRGITVDPNFMTYIYDDKSGGIFEYDKADRDTTTVGETSHC